MSRVVPVITGRGVGPGIVSAVSRVLAAAKVPISFPVSSNVGEQELAAIKQHGAAIAGPLSAADRFALASTGVEASILSTKVASQVTGTSPLYKDVDVTVVSDFGSTADEIFLSSYERANLGKPEAATARLSAVARVGMDAAKAQGKDTVNILTRPGEGQSQLNNLFSSAANSVKPEGFNVGNISTGKAVNDAVLKPETLGVVLAPATEEGREFADIVAGIAGGHARVPVSHSSADGSVVVYSSGAKEDSPADASGLLLSVCNLLRDFGFSGEADKIERAVVSTGGSAEAVAQKLA
jgi:isocitrate/isopropylmalate dehydrogenase